ncbi:MAG: hypothetical protein NC120_13875 [Ruminococcus sp.]|nr:hypothetical protein [Ruminococcus sp.]
MKNLKKTLAMISSIVMAGSVFAACGNTETTPDTTDAPSVADNAGADDASADNAGADDASADNAADDGNDAAPASDVTDEDDVLTILTWESNTDVQAQKKFFCEKNGIDESKINIVTCGADGTAGRDGIQQYMQGSEDADLFTMDADWTPMYINNSSLTVPYSEIGLSKSDFPDNYAYTLSFGTNEAGVFTAASFQAAPGGFVYRSDLAQEYLGVDSPEAMQEKVKDWDTFKATAAELYSASGEKTSITATTAGLWQVFQCYRTTAWVTDGKFQMDTAEDFYDMIKEYVDNKYCADVPQWDAAWYAAVQDGTALGDFVPTWGLTASSGSILSNFAGGAESADNLAICQGPADWNWGGTYYGVSTRCNTKATAKLWIETFCNNQETMKEYALQVGDFVNSKNVMKSIIDEKSNSNPLLGGQDQFAILYDVADGIDYEGKVSRYDSECKQAFNDSVSKLLKGEVADKQAAIDDCKMSVAAACVDVVVE